MAESCSLKEINMSKTKMKRDASIYRGILKLGRGVWNASVKKDASIYRGILKLGRGVWNASVKKDASIYRGILKLGRGVWSASVKRDASIHRGISKLGRGVWGASVICSCFLCLAQCASDKKEQAAVLVSGHTVLVVATAVWTDSGGVSVIDLDDHYRVYDDLSPAGSDVRIRRLGDGLVLINRSGGAFSGSPANNVTSLDAADALKAEAELSTGEQSNPQDIARINDASSLVASLGLGELLQVNLQEQEIEKRIDISSYASEDEIPDASALHRHGDSIYVALQDLLPNHAPAGPGKFLRYDLATEMLSELEAMPFSNPSADFSYYVGELGGTSSEWLVIAAPGQLGSQYLSTAAGNDSGIAAYDLKADNAGWISLLESNAEGEEAGDSVDIANALLVSDSVAFVILTHAPTSCTQDSEDTCRGRLYQFNPKTKVLGKMLLEVPGGSWELPDMLHHNGKLFVADRRDAGGVRIFDIATGEEDPASPVMTSKPPESMVIFELADDALDTIEMSEDSDSGVILE